MKKCSMKGLTLKQCVLLLNSEGHHFLPVFTFENLIDSFILTIMSDTGTDSDCTINNEDIANVDKDLIQVIYQYQVRIR